MHWHWGWVLNWTFIFLCNLPAPIIFGLSSATGSGQVGMLIAIPVLWFLGIIFVMFPGRFRVAFCTGGVVNAFAQFLPIIPGLSGLLSLASLGLLTRNDYLNSSIDSFHVGFAATVLTGQGIALACVILGYPLSSYWKVREPFGINKYFEARSKKADENELE
ncbi:MAG: hypothetical protein U0798_08705 [Gemmataceae bacterium]